VLEPWLREDGKTEARNWILFSPAIRKFYADGPKGDVTEAESEKAIVKLAKGSNA
jgi:hypothetical protein